MNQVFELRDKDKSLSSFVSQLKFICLSSSFVSQVHLSLKFICLSTQRLIVVSQLNDLSRGGQRQVFEVICLSTQVHLSLNSQVHLSLNSSSFVSQLSSSFVSQLSSSFVSQLSSSFVSQLSNSFISQLSLSLNSKTCQEESL